MFCACYPNNGQKQQKTNNLTILCLNIKHYRKVIRIARNSLSTAKTATKTQKTPIYVKENYKIHIFLY